MVFADSLSQTLLTLCPFYCLNRDLLDFGPDHRSIFGGGIIGL